MQQRDPLFIEEMIDAASRASNRIVHGYWLIDLGILHTTATDDLPSFVEQLRSVLEQLDRLDEPDSAGD